MSTNVIVRNREGRVVTYIPGVTLNEIPGITERIDREKFSIEETEECYSKKWGKYWITDCPCEDAAAEGKGA